MVRAFHGAGRTPERPPGIHPLRIQLQHLVVKLLRGLRRFASRSKSRMYCRVCSMISDRPRFPVACEMRRPRAGSAPQSCPARRPTPVVSAYLIQRGRGGRHCKQRRQPRRARSKGRANRSCSPCRYDQVPQCRLALVRDISHFLSRLKRQPGPLRPAARVPSDPRRTPGPCSGSSRRERFPHRRR